MSNIRVPFPKYIDRIRMIGMFELDEFFMVIAGVAVMLIVGFGLALNVALSMGIGLILGGVVAATLRTIKRSYAEGFLFHLAYRKGLFHPVTDDKTMLAKHPEVAKKGLRLMPKGYIGVLVG